jgi:hypothetical protein
MIVKFQGVPHEMAAPSTIPQNSAGRFKALFAGGKFINVNTPAKKAKDIAAKAILLELAAPFLETDGNIIHSSLTPEQTVQLFDQIKKQVDQMPTIKNPGTAEEKLALCLKKIFNTEFDKVV